MRNSNIDKSKKEVLKRLRAAEALGETFICFEMPLTNKDGVRAPGRKPFSRTFHKALDELMAEGLIVEEKRPSRRVRGRIDTYYRLSAHEPFTLAVVEETMASVLGEGHPGIKEVLDALTQRTGASRS